MSESNVARHGLRITPAMAFVGLSLTVFLLVLITTVVITFTQPELFVSTIRVEIEPDTPPSTNSVTPSAAYDSYFVDSEFETLRSEAVLSKAIEALDLNTEWGRRYAGGERLKTGETIALLRDRIEARQVPRTRLVDVGVFSEVPEEAAKIANAVIESYRKYRDVRRAEVAEARYNAIRQEAEAHEQNLNEARAEWKKRNTTVNLDAEAVRRLRSELISNETRLTEKKIQLRQFTQLSPEQRRDALQVAIGPDAEYRSLTAGYYAARSNLFELSKTGDGTDARSHTLARSVADASNRINAHIEGVLLRLSNEVAQLEATNSATRKQLDQSRTNFTVKAEGSMPDQELKNHLNSLEMVSAKIASRIEKQKANMASPTELVTVVDPAVAGNHPARPNKPRNLIYGGCGGLALGVILGGAVAWMMAKGQRRMVHQRGPRRRVQANDI